jgi:hypothetical protein
MTTYLHPLPILRLRGIIPLLPPYVFMARTAQLQFYVINTGMASNQVRNEKKIVIDLRLNAFVCT